MERPVEQAPAPVPESAGKPVIFRAIIRQLRCDVHWIWRKGPTILEQLIATFPTVLNWCTSFSNIDLCLKPGSWLRENYKDLYAGMFGIVLACLLWWRWSVPTLVLWAIAGYRAYDILVYRLYFLLVKGQRKRPWEGNPDKVKRGIVFALVNSYEIVVAYAIMYLISGHIVQGGCKGNPGLPSRTGALYFSLVTMVTFGPGDFSPNKDFMRWVMMFQMVTSALFLIFIIQPLISLWERLSQPQTSRPPCLF